MKIVKTVWETAYPSDFVHKSAFIKFVCFSEDAHRSLATWWKSTSNGGSKLKIIILWNYLLDIKNKFV